jgi:hypothetical protein
MQEEKDTVCIAILAKDKAHCLPLYLKCLYNQTFPKQNIHLYVRTNDNTDDTEQILQDFLNNHAHEYKSVFFDNSPVSETLKQWKQHEWNAERYKILGKIRQDSVDYAKQHNAHYFVVDCDNFIEKSTLDIMYKNRDRGVIGPMLKSKTVYSNYHYEVDPNGYTQLGHPMYYKLLYKEIKGVTAVKVIHCTYFINNNILKEIAYSDGSGRHEYVIFSDILRKKQIEQYLDNREEYGFLTFAETAEELAAEINERWLETIKNL